jgi:DNA-binding CsgD family transcriptional regulator
LEQQYKKVTSVLYLSELCYELTEREVAILELVAFDLSDEEIATKLGLSVKTVRNYLPRFRAKLALPLFLAL